MYQNSQNRREIHFIKKMNGVARTLRQRPTEAEQHLWKYLRRNRLLGYKFRRQHAIGKYIVDFLCYEKKVVVEVDGEIHDRHKEYDAQRDRYLQLYGYSVVRFSNEEVLYNIKSVLNRLAPLLEGGGCHEQRE